MPEAEKSSSPRSSKKPLGHRSTKSILADTKRRELCSRIRFYDKPQTPFQVLGWARREVARSPKSHECAATVGA